MLFLLSSWLVGMLELVGCTGKRLDNTPQSSISKLEFVDNSPTGIRLHGTASEDDAADLADSRIWTTRVDY